MNEATEKIVLRLRLIVGFLCERAQYGWWPTAFFDGSSHLFLEPAFPKTSASAQYHGVVEAARILHDEHLNVGSYHLFRLPEEAEHALHELVQSNFKDEIISQALKSKTATIESLKHMAGNSIIVAEGPTLVGKIEELESISTLEKMAGAYLSAFEHNVKVYPYLVKQS